MSEIDFLPPEYPKRQGHRRRVVRQGVLLGVAWLLLVGWFAARQGNLMRLNQYARSLEAQASALHLQAQQLADLQRQKALLQNRLAVDRELRPAASYTQIVSALSRVMPPALTLLELRLTDSHGPAPTAAHGGSGPPRRGPPLVHLALDGVAPNDGDVADLVGRATDFPLFTSVKLLYCRSQKMGDLTVRNFRMEMDVPLDCRYLPRTAEGVARAH